MTKYSVVVCLLCSIWHSGHTNLLRFLLVKRVTFSWCKPPGSSSDLSAFPCHFILVFSPSRARKRQIKTTGIPVYWFLFTAGILLFSSSVQKSVGVLSFIPMEAGARLLGGYGAGILMPPLLTPCMQLCPAAASPWSQQTVSSSLTTTPHTALPREVWILHRCRCCIL